MQDTGCEGTSCNSPRSNPKIQRGGLSPRKVSSSCRMEILSEIVARAAQRTSSAERDTAASVNAPLKQLDPHVHSYGSCVASFDEYTPR